MDNESKYFKGFERRLKTPLIGVILYHGSVNIVEVPANYLIMITEVVN